MTTVTEAIYERGVLKLEDAHGLKERQRYRVILQEIVEPLPLADPALAAELEQRTTILPDGRKIIRLMGLFADRIPTVPDNQDPIAEALDELKRERAAQFEAKAHKFLPDTSESGT